MNVDEKVERGGLNEIVDIVSHYDFVLYHGLKSSSVVYKFRLRLLGYLPPWRFLKCGFDMSTSVLEHQEYN